MDIYNSKIAAIAHWINGADPDIGFAITTSATCTRYTVSGPDKVSERWLKHEDCHKGQFKRYGWLVFVVKYFYYNIRYGYQNNPFEAEASMAEHR